MDRVRDAFAASGIVAELAPFFTDIADRLGKAHLVIARAGASTVAELAVAGRPAILVPLPGAIDDHQRGNARSLTDMGGAWTMAQPDFTPPALTARLQEILTAPEALATAASAARTLARDNAAAALADNVESLIRQEARR